MHWKKIMPLALAAAIAAAPAAGAAHTQQPDSLLLQTQQFGWLCELPDWDIPSQRPETAPDQTPEQAPDTEQTPEEQPDSTPEQTPEQDNGTAQGDYASQVAVLVNEVRAQYGLAALTVDTKVQRAAQVRAAETAQSFSHTRPDGSSFSAALTEAGVAYRTSGENIAYGQSTPQAVVDAWMNSSGHRANILSSSFTSIGVGYTVVNGTAYWAQLFIG